MRRREFLSVLGGAAAAWPLAARAQQVGRVYRIGVFAGATNAVMVLAYRGFLDELRKLDFIEGQNLTVDRRSTAQTPAALSANPAARRRGDRIGRCLLQRMSLLLAHCDRYCAGTECRFSGYCGHRAKRAPIASVANDPKRTFLTLDLD
jgi:hypothetical protein